MKSDEEEESGEREPLDGKELIAEIMRTRDRVACFSHLSIKHVVGRADNIKLTALLNCLVRLGVFRCVCAISVVDRTRLLRRS